jgi:hypothetical protein
VQPPSSPRAECGHGSQPTFFPLRIWKRHSPRPADATRCYAIELIRGSYPQQFSARVPDIEGRARLSSSDGLENRRRASDRFRLFRRRLLEGEFATANLAVIRSMRWARGRTLTFCPSRNVLMPVGLEDGRAPWR